MLSSIAESRCCWTCFGWNDRASLLLSEVQEVGEVVVVVEVEVVEGSGMRVLYTELALGASILSAMLKQ